MDNSPENNPQQPANNPDPAKIAYHYKATIINKEAWDDKIHVIKMMLQDLEEQVKLLQEFSFLVGVEHEHN